MTALTDPLLQDPDPVRIVAWSLLRHRALTPDETRQVLDQAFNLITLASGGKTWWVFERRTAPEFVYIRPQMWVYLNDGWVVHAEAANTPGNGVEVYETSAGRGPFAASFPCREDGTSLADEFRLYYKVVYARSLPWLEGYESFLDVHIPDEDASERPEQPPEPYPSKVAHGLTGNGQE
jgi:hypothetical protein